MRKISPRNPWTAAGMSLLLPGFGQIYNGEVNKAIWLFLCFALLSVPGIALVALYLPGPWMAPTLALGLAATLSLWLYGAVDAWREAKSRPDHELRDWQVSGMYLLVLLACNFVILPSLIGYVRAHDVEALRIPSRSMEPAVLQGDFIFADKRYNCPGCKHAIHRGDIAIFTYPNNRTLLYIKRIVALPGDQVTLGRSGIEVNGKPLADPAGSGSVPLPEQTVTVPPGQVFVLGDNRRESVDSRNFGCVPMQDVVGKARQVWFSLGAEGVRWNRIGHLLR